MATPQRQAAIQKEGRIELALQAYQQGQFSTPIAAAKAYDVTRSTLQRRINGIPSRLGSISKKRLLTSTEEESLVQWILSMDRRGMPPRIAIVRKMASLLVTQRFKSTTPLPTGQNWVRKFIDRHDTLKSKYNRKYDYQRAKCEDPELIRAWFQRVQATIAEYGIHEDDIYNFDETGFQMGVISTAKVITGSDRAGRPRTTQPGNREWVTVIETICARGLAIPPLIIFEAVMHQAAWYEKDVLPHHWSIGVSPNGWTNNEIGLIWLKTVFDKYTKNRSVGRYRLLILDGHGSHVTPEFDQYCLDQSIIVLCMPPHSSHLLQSLDVGCFSVLKRSYGKRVETLMSLGVNQIDKQEFLSIYQDARAEALHQNNVRSGFAATGLVPYEPDRVLSLLHVQYHTPSPQLRPHTQPAWTAETPHDIVELEHQTKLIKQHLRCRTQSPPSPTEQALNQLVKGCQMAMHNAVLLASQNKKLFTENQRQKRKRAQRRSYIAREGVLTGGEAQNLIEIGNNGGTAAVEEAESGVRQRAPPKCSVCSSLAHNARTCPERQSIV
jgi:hypothetical protein